MKYKRPSQANRILAVLKEGGWHTTLDLHRASGSLAVHSRINELRNRKLGILKVRLDNERGRTIFAYQLA